MLYSYKGKKYQIQVKKLYIELTTRCNARCPYCYNSAGIHNDNIDTEKLICFLNRELGQEIAEVHLSGGEPLMHQDYWKFVNLINEKGLPVLTVSNAFLITEKFLDDYMEKNKLQLTIDSMLEEEHDRTRGKGNYQKVMQAIEYCQKRGFSENINLRHNVLRSNCEDLQEFVEFAISKNIANAAMSVLRNMGRAKEYPEMVYDYKRNLQELLVVNTKMHQLSESFSGKIHVKGNTFENQSGCPFNRPQDFLMSPRIDYLGNLYICESFDGEDNIVGNVFENSLEEIFVSKRFEEYMTILFERQDNNSSCKKCLLKHTCTGGCPADQYNEAGNYRQCTSQCI